MEIQAQPVIQNNGQPFPGYLDIVWSTNDLPPGTEKIAVRYITPVTPDNEIGFKEVNAFKPASAGHARPGGFPSGVRISVYCQAQIEYKDVGLPSNAVNIIVP